MKLLEVEFMKNGYLYKQIKRSDRVAIYTQQLVDGLISKPPSTRVFYEVIIIRKHKEATYPDGKVSPAREIYPHEQKWGIQGFTYTIITQAAMKFLELEKRFG